MGKFCVKVTLLFVFIWFPQRQLSHAQDVEVIKWPGYRPPAEVVLDARSAAMGGTSLGAAGSPALGYVHPAGMAFLNHGGLSGSYLNWIADISHYGGAAGLRLGRYNTLGVLYRAIDYGELTAAIEPDYRSETIRPLINEMSIISAREFGAGLAMAGQLHYNWQQPSYFWGFKSSRISDNLALSLGMIVQSFWNDLNIGLSYRHIPFTSQYEDRHRSRMLQMSMTVDILQVLHPILVTEHSSLTLATDWVSYQVDDDEVRLGLEYGFWDHLFGRAGYQFDDDFAKRARWSWGAGIDISIPGMHLQCDYAYRDLVYWEPVHWLSLNLVW